MIAVHGRHRFLGELSLLTGGTVYLTAVVRDPGEVVQVPVAKLRKLLSRDEELANIVLGAYLSRRTILIEAQAGVRVVGSRYSGDTLRIKEFLTRNGEPYSSLDVDDPHVQEVIDRFHVSVADVSVTSFMSRPVNIGLTPTVRPSAAGSAVP